MSHSARDRALVYLSDHNVLTLATAGPEGLWAAAVFYVNDGFTLYFLSAPNSRHSLNLASHSTVAATIQEDYKDWREIKGIQLEGRASRLDGEEQAAARTHYATKFPFIADLARAPNEIARALSQIAWYRIVPSRLYFIDNSLGLGHRDEISLTITSLV